MKKEFNILHCLGFIILIELIGNIGSLATFSQIDTWYTTLAKPAFNPPNWVFGPVWTTLFALMGISLYLVWLRAEKPQFKTALAIFSPQLTLNVLWSFIFFGWHQPGLAFAEILVLWVAIAATISIFYKISRLAAWLMIPYLAWVTFAAILNFAIWQLN